MCILYVFVYIRVSAHIWVFHSVLFRWVQFSSVRFIDELSSMCATEFRSVNDVISTYIIPTLYWIGKSLFSHRLRTFILLSALSLVRSFVRCIHSLLGLFCFSCPQFIGIIAFSVYGFMCSLCMYIHAPPVIYNTNYAPKCVPIRLLCDCCCCCCCFGVHNIISTLCTHNFRIQQHIFFLWHGHACLYDDMQRTLARCFHAKQQKTLQPLRSCCSAIHKKQNKTKNEKRSQ